MGLVTKLPGSRLFFNLFKWSTIKNLIDHQKWFQSGMNDNHTSYIVMHQPKSKFLLGQLPLRMPFIPVTSPSSNLPRGWVSVGQIILLLTLRHFEIPYNPTKKYVWGNDSLLFHSVQFRWGCQVNFHKWSGQLEKNPTSSLHLSAVGRISSVHLLHGVLDLPWVDSYIQDHQNGISIMASVKQGKNNHILCT